MMLNRLPGTCLGCLQRTAPPPSSPLIYQPHQQRRVPLRRRQLRAQAGSNASPLIQPSLKEAAAFAPATVANLGPGYDWMGCAVEVRA